MLRRRHLAGGAGWPAGRLRLDLILAESYLASGFVHVALAVLVALGAPNVDDARTREARRARALRMVRASFDAATAQPSIAAGGAFRLDLRAGESQAAAKLKPPAPTLEARRPTSIPKTTPAHPKRTRRRPRRRSPPLPAPSPEPRPEPQVQPIQAASAKGAAELAPTPDTPGGQTAVAAPSDAPAGETTGSAEGATQAHGDDGSTSASASGPGPNLDALLHAWVEEVSAAVHRTWRYPRSARRAGLQGEVVLEFRVDGRGRIHDVRVARSSGHRLLDEAAVAAVEQIASVPPPPPVLAWGDRLVRVPFVYALRG